MMRINCRWSFKRDPFGDPRVTLAMTDTSAESTGIERTGGCACGGVRFVATGEPLRMGLCHCLTCQRAHAAAYNPFIV